MENQIFTSKEFGEIRTHVDEKGEPWFCLLDVCMALDLTSWSVRKRLGDNLISSQVISDTLGRRKKALFVNEDGLYDVILESRKPEARAFRKWVTSEVLPAIRKTGGYMRAGADEPDEVILSRALLIMQKALERRDKRIAELEPRAAYADEVIDSISCLTTTQVAKGLGMTAIELNRRLCHSHVQYFQSGQYLLYADYARAGYAQNRTYTYRDSEGETRTHSYLVWTERGREFIHRLLFTTDYTDFKN